MATDAMFKLEHGVKDEQKSKAAQPTLGQLQVISTSYFSLQKSLLFHERVSQLEPCGYHCKPNEQFQ